MKRRHPRTFWPIPVILLLGLGSLLQACAEQSSGAAASAGDADGADVPETAQETPAGTVDGASAAAGENGHVVSPAGAVDANAVLAAGLAEADRTKRLVFLHSGASW